MPRLASSIRWARLGAVSLAFIVVFEAIIMFVPRRRRADVYLRLMRLWGRVFLWGNRISIEGAGNIPRGEPVIFASNHQSNFDIPLFHALIPVSFSWLSRHDLFHAPLIGRVLRRIGAAPVVRHEKRKAAGAVDGAMEMLKSGRSVVIFPEGTWGDRQGRARSFKRGVLRIARKSGAVVVPVTIIGANLVNPPDSGEVNPGEMKVIVHPPLSAGTWEHVPDAEWLDHLRSIITSPLPCGAEMAEARPPASHTRKA